VERPVFTVEATLLIFVMKEEYVDAEATLVPPLPPGPTDVE
jgi:hypothetical protein